MVCLNAGVELEKTIQSVLSQTYLDYEVIIKDGGSSDGSLACVPNDDTRIHLIEESDTGVYDAMNQGLKHASGEWVQFLNAGDYLEEPEVLSKLAALMEDDSAINFWYGPYRNRFLAQTIWQPTNFKGFTAYRQVVCHQTQFLRKALFEQLGGFDASLKIRADHDFFLRALKQGMLNSQTYDFIAISYADDGLSVSEKMRRCAALEAKELHRRHFVFLQQIMYAILLEISLVRFRCFVVRRLKGSPLATLYARLANAYNQKR